ncbi:MAG: uracil-DNA glycosylase family protein [Polaromonas sp.]
MTLTTESTPKTGLSLDKRQRAMLKEMGVQVWQPLAKTAPQLALTPVAAPTLKAPLSAMDSEAAHPEIQVVARAIDTPKQVFQAPTAVAPAPRVPSTTPSTTSGTTSGISAWRIGKLQPLYPPQSVTSATRWLVLMESPASALQEPFKPFDGDAGKLLDNMLRAARLHTAGSVMLAPLVRANNAGGSGGDLTAELAEVLASAHADVVLVMGRLAAQAVLQSTEPLASLRGHIHRLHGAKTVINTIVTLDPAYLLRYPLDKAKAWDDLCLAISVAAAS